MKTTAEPVHNPRSLMMENGVAVHTNQQDQSQSKPNGQDAQQESPYWFQDEAVESTIGYFTEKIGKHPLVVMPTGSGKSHVLGKFVKRVLSSWADQRILVLTHREKLIEQDYRAICNYWAKGEVGMYSAGLKLRQRRKVTVAGIQSVWRKPELFEHYTVILVDEAHMIPPKSTGQYRTFLGNFPCPVIGLTATHFRLGSGYLHKGEGRLFDGIAYECDMLVLMDQGYLCKLLPRETDAHLDTEGLHTQNGDFKKDEMVNRFDKASITQPIINDLLKYREKRRKWLVFAIDIDHCEHIAEALRKHGMTAQTVHSKLSRDERIVAHELYERGSIQALVSVETLTTGFDDPEIDLIALVRPTKSPVMHIQMIGRGLRTSPGKEDCMILDYAGNIKRLGPINDVHVPEPKKKKKGSGKVVTKHCPVCDAETYASALTCTVCGFTFLRDTHLEIEAGTEEIVATKKKAKGWPRWYDVEYISLSRPASDLIRINFRCTDGNTFYKQDTASLFHAAANTLLDFPPKRILIKRKRFYPWKEVIDYEF